MNTLNQKNKNKLSDEIINNISKWENILNELRNNLSKNHPLNAIYAPDFEYIKKFNFNTLSFSVNEAEMTKKGAITIKSIDEDYIIKKNEIKQKIAEAYYNFPDTPENEKISLFLKEDIHNLRISPSVFVFCKDNYDGRVPNGKELDNYIYSMYDRFFKDFRYEEKFSTIDSRRYLKSINEQWLFGFQIPSGLAKKLTRSTRVINMPSPMIILMNKEVNVKNLPPSFYMEDKKVYNALGLLYSHHFFFHYHFELLDNIVQIESDFQKKHLFYLECLSTLFVPLLNYLEEIVISSLFPCSSQDHFKTGSSI